MRRIAFLLALAALIAAPAAGQSRQRPGSGNNPATPFYVVCVNGATGATESCGGDVMLGDITIEDVVLAAGNNNIGDVDVASIAAGNNNIGNVDVVTLPNVTIDTDDPVSTSLVDIAEDIDFIRSSLNVDASEGNSETLATSGPVPVGVAKDFDGGSLLHVVAEDQMVRQAFTLSGISFGFLTNELGTKELGKPEDQASADGDYGVSIWAIRDDTLDVRSATEGDYEPFHTNANGALWAIDVNSAAALTSTQLIDDAVFADDAAFTPATSKGFAVGGQADDTATDAVDEGDFGAFRISLDRLLYTRMADPCSGGATKLYLPFDITGAATTEITPSLAGSSTNYYICALNIVNGGTANNVNLVDDNTDGCGSVTASLISSGLAAGDGWNFAANGGLTIGNGLGSVMRTQTANSVLCLVTSASSELHGQFVVVAAP